MLVKPIKFSKDWRGFIGSSCSESETTAPAMLSSRKRGSSGSGGDEGKGSEKRARTGPTPRPHRRRVSNLGKKLLKACEDGNTAEADRLIREGAPVNHKNDVGVTPLYVASEHGHTEIVMLLVDKGAKLNITTDEGNTPLIMAAWHNDMATVRVLVDAGADTKISGSCNKTADEEADHGKGTGPIAQYIRTARAARGQARPPSRDPGARSPGQRQHRDAERLPTPAQVAARASTALPAPTPTPGSGGRPAHAGSSGSSGLPPPPPERLPLPAQAAAGRNVGSSGNGGSDSQSGGTPRPHSRRVSILGKKLMRFCAEGKPDKAKNLIMTQGAKIDWQDDEKVTPLHEASKRGFEDVARVLVESKARLNMADHNGETPLIYAAWNGQFNVVRLLVEAKADVTIRCDKKKSAAEWASEEGYEHVAKYLEGEEKRLQGDQRRAPPSPNAQSDSRPRPGDGVAMRAKVEAKEAGGDAMEADDDDATESGGGDDIPTLEPPTQAEESKNRDDRLLGKRPSELGKFELGRYLQLRSDELFRGEERELISDIKEHEYDGGTFLELKNVSDDDLRKVVCEGKDGRLRRLRKAIKKLQKWDSEWEGSAE